MRQPPRVMPGQVAPALKAQGAGREELICQSGKQLLQDVAAAQEQDMRMAGLRHALARLRPLGTPVALDQRDLLEMVRQDASR